MRTESYTLDFPATTGAPNGTAQTVADLQSKYIQITSLTGTADLEGHVDGTWVKLITGVANGIAAVAHTVKQVRMVRTGNGAGTATIIGQNFRAT